MVAKLTNHDKTKKTEKDMYKMHTKFKKLKSLTFGLLRVFRFLNLKNFEIFSNLGENLPYKIISLKQLTLISFWAYIKWSYCKRTNIRVKERF